MRGMVQVLGLRPADQRAVRRVRRSNRGVPLVVAVAALGGGLSGVEPSGLVAVDAVLGAVAAASVTAAASVSRRWTWLVLTGIAAAVPSPPLWRAVALAALGLSLVSVWTRRRNRLLGAVIGAMAVQTLLRLDPTLFHGSTALVALAAAAPVLVVGLRYAQPSTRRLAGRGVLVAGTVAVVLTAIFTVGLIRGRAAAEHGLTTARQGLVAAAAGDTEEAAERFTRATEAFERAESMFSAWWMKPARAVPVVGQHLAALDTATRQGSALAAAAGVAARSADTERWALRQGQFDLELIRTMAQPLDTSADILEGAGLALAEVASPWLVDPLRDRLAGLEAEIEDRLPAVRLAADAAQVLPGLLGGDGQKRYLVLFATPAEARELGGILGNYAEVTAADGELALGAFGRNSDLNRRATSGFTDPDSFPDRFTRMEPWRFAQNFPGSPDLPTVARAVADLYPRMGGSPVDGVLYVDPFAVAVLLQLTGPVEVDGLDRPLTSETAAWFLLRDQYELFDAQGARVDMLAEVSETTMRRLLEIDLPGPARLAELFGPLVRAGRLQFIPFDPEGEDLTADLGLDGGFPAPGRDDFMAVVHSNAAANKLDAYLRREVHYDAQVDQATGKVDATSTVVLHNEAPAGLPPYVLGGTGDSTGAAMRIQLSLYTPHRLEALTVDGRPVSAEPQWELDRWRYLVEVDIPRGGDRTLSFDLTGEIDVSGDYRLVMANQPTAIVDEVEVTIRPTTTSPALVAEEEGSSRGAPAEWTFRHDEDVELRADWLD